MQRVLIKLEFQWLHNQAERVGAMIKRLVVLVMSCLFICAACFAEEQDVVDSFKAHVQNIMQPILATYKDDTTHLRYFDPGKHGLQGSGHWFKVRNLEPVYFLDIKKNDSVMYPYTGILEIEKYTEIFTGKYPTQEAAAKAEKSYLSNAMQHWRFYYGYQNGKWEKTKVEFYRDTEKRFMNEKTTVTEYDIFANR